MMKSNVSESGTATPDQQPLVEIACGIEGYPGPTASPSGRYRQSSGGPVNAASAASPDIARR
jgi:hypothetical protein